MSVLRTTTKFDMDFVGTMTNVRGCEVKMGRQEGGQAPYDLLLGALASCLYATFLGIVEKKKLSFDEALIEVSGEKREDVPTTLKWCNVMIKVKNPSAKNGFEDAADLAAKYCSIYQTLTHVADMSIAVDFIE